ncbi:hypothetical protein [Ostreiculturibacter nitratireducens]|uniref:hypothetical protein n=1 Tax=Ostreiculturibacter nitratireducens TaxID=3075226 RepID=UPI0031B59A06
MTRKLTAAIAAAAVALSSMIATPAAAMTEDQALKLLLGALAVGVIVDKLDDNDHKKKRTARTYTDTDYRRAYPDRDYRRDYPDRDHRHHHPDWDHGRDPGHARYDGKGRVIPRDCIFEIRTRRGVKHVVGERCVERSQIRAKLPRSCEIEIRGPRHERSVYGLSCLRDHGFKVGAARRR